MRGRGRGGPPRGGRQTGYVNQYSTKLPEDRDVQEGRQSNLLSVGGPPRVGTYNDKRQGGWGGGSQRGRPSDGRGGGPSTRGRPRDNGYAHRTEPFSHRRRLADTYRPAEEGYSEASLPPRPQTPTGPRWRGDSDAGSSRSHYGYNPPSPSPRHIHYNTSSDEPQAPPSEYDYNPPSPPRAIDHDELQDDLKPTVDPRSVSPAPPPPVMPAAPPPPVALDPGAEALRKMSRFKPVATTRPTPQVPPAIPVPAPVAAAPKRDVKPTREELDGLPPAEVSDDPNRNSGVLALSWRDLPPIAQGPATADRKKVRAAAVQRQMALLASQGRRITKGGVRWRDDGCSIDWENIPAAEESRPSEQPQSANPPAIPVVNNNREPPRSGFGLDPGPISTPESLPSETSRTDLSSTAPRLMAEEKGKQKVSQKNGDTSSQDKPKGRRKSAAKLQKAKARWQLAREEHPELVHLKLSKFKKAVREKEQQAGTSSKRQRSPDEASIRFSSPESSSSISSVKEPISKRKKTSAPTSEAKPSATSSRQTQLPTPTPSDPDLAAMANIAELEASLKTKVTEIDRWTKMQKDYPDLKAKTQGQIDGLQEEIGRVYDEIRRLKGRA